MASQLGASIAERPDLALRKGELALQKYTSLHYFTILNTTNLVDNAQAEHWNIALFNLEETDVSIRKATQGSAT